jgi:Putative peptidoglycan binding domain
LGWYGHGFHRNGRFFGPGFGFFGYGYPWYGYPYYPYSAPYYGDPYYDSGYYGGPIDGVFGPETRGAIRSFQAHQGLPVTGQVDSRLVRALQS